MTIFCRAARRFHVNEDEDESSEQSRLFSQINNWPFQLNEMLADEQMVNDEAQPESDNPERLFIDELTFNKPR